MTRAKLINKKNGQTLTGQMLHKGVDTFDFRIDDTTLFNNFCIHDWDLETIKPRVEELPDGLYQVKFTGDGGQVEHAATYRKTDEGIKNALNNVKLTGEDLKVLQDYYEKGRLVRLVREPVIFEEAS